MSICLLACELLFYERSSFMNDPNKSQFRHEFSLFCELHHCRRSCSLISQLPSKGFKMNTAVVLRKGSIRPSMLLNSIRTYRSGISRSQRALPANTIIKFVPQQEAWVVERMGKFNRVLDPGLAILIPILDQIRYVKSLKEVAVEVPAQSAITQDNVTLSIDGVLYFKIEDPYKASYGIEDAEYAITNLAQTTMVSFPCIVHFTISFKLILNPMFVTISELKSVDSLWTEHLQNVHSSTPISLKP